MGGEDTRGVSAFYVGDCRLDFGRLEVHRPSGVQALTPLEGQVLHYLAERADRVVSRSELLVKVWGYRPTANTRAPSLLMSRVRRKLGDPSLVQTLRGTGYRLSAGVWEGTASIARTLPDPSFPLPLVELKRLLSTRPALERCAQQPGDPGIRARMELSWLSLVQGERVVPALLWRDAESAHSAELSLRSALLALQAVERSGTWTATLAAVERIRALNVWRGIDQSIAQCVMACVSCTAHARLGRLDAAEASADRATDLAEMLGHPKLLAVASDRRAFLARRQHKRARAQEYARDAAAFAEDTPCLVTQVEIINNLGTLHYLLGELDSAAGAYTQALELARSLGGQAYLVSILASLVAVRLNQGQLDACERQLEALQRTPSMGSPRQHEMRMEYHRGRVAIERGDWALAQQHLTRSIHLASRLGERRVESASRLYTVWLALWGGAWHAAWEELQSLPPKLEDIGDHELAGAAWLWRAWCAMRLGLPHELALTHAVHAFQRSNSQLGEFVGMSPTESRSPSFLGRRCVALRQRVLNDGLAPG